MGFLCGLENPFFGLLVGALSNLWLCWEGRYYPPATRQLGNPSHLGLTEITMDFAMPTELHLGLQGRSGFCRAQGLPWQRQPSGTQYLLGTK